MKTRERNKALLDKLKAKTQLTGYQVTKYDWLSRLVIERKRLDTAPYSKMGVKERQVGAGLRTSQGTSMVRAPEITLHASLRLT